MANYRNISMDFWSDSKVVDDFTPEDRYIYLYCMTNPHTNLCGCYEVSIKQIANETGYNADSVERLLKRLDSSHNVIRYSAQTKELLILNWCRYRSPDASMTWIFEDGVLETKVTGGTFTISKTLRGKIENVLIKMITYWQQYFFRDVMEKNALRAGLMPVIDEEEAEDGDRLPDGAEPLEEFEEDLAEVPGMDDDEGESPEPPEEEEISEAIAIVRAENKATTGLLQRRMNIGYAKAARLIDTLEEMGVVGSYSGSEPREVLPCDLPDEPDGGDGNE